MRTRQKGFTLVELMVAVAIVMILARIAYVSYTKQVVRSNRTDAEQMLMQMAQAEERFYATHDYYQSNTTSIGITSTSTPTAQTPAYPAAAIYTMTINPPTSTSSTLYTITASPVSGKLNNLSGGTTDGTLTIDQTGKKCWYKNGGSTCQAWSSN